MRTVFLSLVVLSCGLPSLLAADGPATADRLRCEYRVDPLGIDVAQPRLSWEMQDSRRGAAQTAYQVLVASTPERLSAGEGDLWDSGKVESNQSTQVTYAGKPLASRARCHWNVRIWDHEGKPSAPSQPALWTMGLLKPEDVTARWIGLDGPQLHPENKGTQTPIMGDKKPKPVYGCPLLRKDFQPEGKIRRATLYASALGVYRVYLNGKPVGNDYFTPDWTEYGKRVYYNTYDVTGLLRDGTNAVGGVLGPGWYSSAIGWELKQNNYGDRPRLLAQLEIEREDGTIQTIVTDSTWKTAWGPYLEGEFLAGETYDARRELPGWNAPGFDDSAWKPVAVTPSIPARLQAFPGIAVQETGEVKPVRITEPKPGTYIFDLGQNFSGITRLKASGPAGTKVQLRFVEMLNKDGTIYVTNLRGARCIDTYVLRGQGEEVWQPRFTYHGFRYVEVTGYPGKPAEDALTGIMLNSATPLAGAFECSSPMVNKLYSNIIRTQKGNFVSVPTDCPQRDERLGWTGDAEVFVRAATYNADVAAFFTKWLVDLEDAQGADGNFPDVAPRIVATGGGTAAWGDAGTICPWTIYQVYGDRRVLEKHFDAMARWVEFCRKNSKDLLRPAAGYGDWLSINAATPPDVLATAFFAYSTHLTANAAHVLGKGEDAKKYDDLFDQIKAAFNKAYVQPDGRIKGNTQTCYVLGLWFDLLPQEKRKAAIKYLVEDIEKRGTLSTGFIGTSVLMPNLTAIGQTPLAYKLLLSEKFPSWGYSIKHGATSIWERWDGWTPEKGFQDPGMNSFAHYSFGAVARWMFQSVAGIDTAEPGFQKLIIRPRPCEGLTHVKASYHSVHGPIATAWKRDGGSLALSVGIPANTTALICVPARDAASVTEGGKPVAEVAGLKFLKMEDGAAVYRAGAGRYEFRSDVP